ncbi:MAG: hypothetical protein JSR37_04220 [Verrucomicrobia bacterium]|nr:hypothetical protein [Verrucomicrobiota bacterium]MBS0636531.1 hypothetical protein [Verrucomicrobiota bacterium]
MKKLLSLFLVGFMPLVAQDYVASQNAFCFNLINALGAPEENLCVSPYNISSALELAYFGAADGTKNEIAQTLQLPMMADKELASEIKKSEQYLGKAAINAKALAVDNTFLPTDYYLQIVKDDLEADVFEVNFRKKPQEACDSINNWASKMTQGRITNLLEPSNVNDATKLVLLSSIYIKSSWLTPFEVHKTQDAPFTTPKGEKTVQMMEQTKEMRLFQNGDVKVVWRDLEQKNQNEARLEVLFVLPENLNTKLSLDQIASWDKAAKSEYVQLFVPKCSVRQRLSVKKALQSLGMKLAFSQNADFSVLSPKNDLMVDDVLHSAFMQLNEAGIEAAAATAVTMVTKSALIPKNEPIVVRCDKPFYVLIREKATGLVLFVSLIANPQAVEK